jgi:hypothetical protein
MIDAEWSRIAHPALAVALCLIPTGIGGVLLYGAWRIFAAGKRAPSHVAQPGAPAASPASRARG